MVKVYNRKKETHNKNDFYIGRGSPLGNPYTHIKDRQTKALYLCPDRDSAIDAYSHYFDIMYGSNKAFTEACDKIYEVYKTGEDVYLGCYCKPLRCHGDILAEKLQEKLSREKIAKFRKAL